MVSHGPGFETRRDVTGGEVDAADAFEAFYRHSSPRVLGYVYLNTGDLAASEDAVAEAFARAWQRWSSVSRADSPEAWVRTVAHRTAISQWRKWRNRLATHGNAHFRADLHADQDDLRAGSLPGVGPEHVALVAALKQLPVRHRQAIVLHHLVDRSVADIADELDVAEGTVKAWLSRGRAAMREHLQVDSP